MVRFGRQFLLLALASLAIPACGGGNNGNSSAGGKSQELFKEDFSGAFPGTSWSAPFSTGTGTSIQIGDEALRMTTTGDPSFVGTTTMVAFASRPMTLTVKISETGSGEGSGGVAILDHNGASIAAAEWHAATPSALTFRILSATNPTPVAVPLSGSGFHSFTFTVSASGEASWMLDGTMVMTGSGFPDDLVKVQLYDNIGSTSSSSFALFQFDDVTITSP